VSDRIPNEGADPDNRLEKLLADRQGELSTMHDQAEEYWLSQEKEIKLRVYQQFDFGGYHLDWLDELWALHRDLSVFENDGDPLEWFITWWIVPEEDGFYLDGTSYLIDVKERAVRDRNEGERITEVVFDHENAIATKDEHAKRVVSTYFAVLVSVLRRLLRLFVIQNADLMSNAPTFKRVFYMEREATLGILEYLQEEMKRRAESPENAADVTARE